MRMDTTYVTQVDVLYQYYQSHRDAIDICLLTDNSIGVGVGINANNINSTTSPLLTVFLQAKGYSISQYFMKEWCAVVHTLTTLQKSIDHAHPNTLNKPAHVVGGELEIEDEQEAIIDWVEQEGCPEEEDVNRYAVTASYLCATLTTTLISLSIHHV